jgi:predicted AAA+ superfamily ATPase
MIERTLSQVVAQVSKSFPVLLVTGPRQVGKTTLLETCSEKGRRYVSLDDLEQRELAQTDPALFLQRHKPPVTIDEVQYAPELFSYIKMAVDKSRQPGMFWLTGSQKFHLMKGISESLAGRVAIIDMLGLSQA